MVTGTAGQDSYRPSSRNGIESLGWGAYSSGFRVATPTAAVAATGPATLIPVQQQTATAVITPEPSPTGVTYDDGDLPYGLIGPGLRGIDDKAINIHLSSGFTPDPWEVRWFALDGVNDLAYEIGDGCTGYANWAQPQVRLIWSPRPFTDTDQQYPLNIWVTAATDLTLVVNQPDNTWICNDDANGFDPAIQWSSPQVGVYDIWVGTHSGPLSSAGVEPVLYISELMTGR
jgi:hypothetical protein